MRTAVYGSEILVDSKGFVGVNLGYYFYAEHEWLDVGLIQSFNQNTIYGTEQKVKYMKSMHDIEKKYKNEQIKEYILNPEIVKTFKRTIQIDNTGSKYSDCLCYNDEYIAFYMANRGLWSFDKRSEYIQSGKTYKEDDLLYQDDYSHNKTGEQHIITGNNMVCRETDIAATWDDSTPELLILFRKTERNRYVIKELEIALKEKRLAICNKSSMFKDRGLILFNADRR